MLLFREMYVFFPCCVCPFFVCTSNFCVGVGVPVGLRTSRPALGSTQPPIQWVLVALSPGVKQPGCEVDYSPPTSAEVKKMWIYISTPIRLHGIVLN
jgi:hypothetical protein